MFCFKPYCSQACSWTICFDWAWLVYQTSLKLRLKLGLFINKRTWMSFLSRWARVVHKQLSSFTALDVMLSLWDTLKIEKKEKMKKYKWGHSAIWCRREKREKSQSVRAGAVLKNYVSESKQKRRENLESKIKLWEVHSEEESNEWKKKKKKKFLCSKLYL